MKKKYQFTLKCGMIKEEYFRNKYTCNTVTETEKREG